MKDQRRLVMDTIAQRIYQIRKATSYHSCANQMQPSQLNES